VRIGCGWSWKHHFHLKSDEHRFLPAH
jgi:hypothetical protein